MSAGPGEGVEVPGSGGEAPGAERAPLPPGRWERLRWPLVVLTLLVAAVALLVATDDDTNRLSLHPASVAPDGARAVARLLEDGGVEVRPSGRLERVAELTRGAGGRATVLVRRAEELSPQAVERLAGLDADVVLLAPEGPVVAELLPGLRDAGTAPRSTTAPGCTAPAPTAAGRAGAGGRLYAPAGGEGGADGGARPVADVGDPLLCYPAGQGWSYAQARTPAGRTVTALGQSAVLTNEALDEQGNAALALRVLGGQPTLFWYEPGPVDTAEQEGPSLGQLLPRWLAPALAVLAAAGVLLLLAHGRRLGRLVPEPLPVVVRSAETVEGRGRLYARADALERAAAALRAGTLRRCCQRLRLGRGTSVGAGEVAEAVAAATGRPAAGVHALLQGPPPADEDALVRLAAELELLERHLAAPAPPPRRPGAAPGVGAHPARDPAEDPTEEPAHDPAAAHPAAAPAHPRKAPRP
ncbi:DUF4350 domain-containing protein [Kineococcus sp. NUM-3379]